MEQALVVILLELRKTPRLILGRFSEADFSDSQNRALTHLTVDRGEI